MLNDIKGQDDWGLEVIWNVTFETESPILKRKSEIQILIPMRLSCKDEYSFTTLYKTFKGFEGFNYNDFRETMYNILGRDFYLFDTLNNKSVKSAYIYKVNPGKTRIPAFSKKNRDLKKLWILTFSLDCKEDVIYNKYLYSSIEDVNDIVDDFNTIIENFRGDGTAFRNSLKRSDYMKYCSPHIDIFDEEDVLDATLLRFESRDLYPVYTDNHEEVTL